MRLEILLIFLLLFSLYEFILLTGADTMPVEDSKSTAYDVSNAIVDIPVVVEEGSLEKIGTKDEGRVDIQLEGVQLESVEMKSEMGGFRMKSELRGF